MASAHIEKQHGKKTKKDLWLHERIEKHDWIRAAAPKVLEKIKHNQKSHILKQYCIVSKHHMPLKALFFETFYIILYKKMKYNQKLYILLYIVPMVELINN